MDELMKETVYTGIYLSDALATNQINQKVHKDPVLYPSLANDEVIKEWPVTVVQTSEYDNFKQSSHIF